MDYLQIILTSFTTIQNKKAKSSRSIVCMSLKLHTQLAPVGENSLHDVDTKPYGAIFRLQLWQRILHCATQLKL